MQAGVCWKSKRVPFRPSFNVSMTGSRRPWTCSTQCKGKVVVSGMGKSGLIGQKIAATMASTGTPSFFLHPAEGLHGDLGMLARARCPHCDLEQRRDAGNLAALALHGAHGYSCRGDRRPHEFDPGQEQRRRVGCVRRRRGLPHGTGADGEHHRDARDGRCLGRRAAREARVQGTGFCAIPSRWDARTPVAGESTGPYAQRDRISLKWRRSVLASVGHS